MSSHRTRLAWALALFSWLLACDRGRPDGTPAAGRGTVAPAPTVAPTPTAPGAAAPHGQVDPSHGQVAMPHGQVAAQPPAGDRVTGKILETMDSGGYTYVHLDTATGAQWAAVPQTKLAVGATINIANPMVMTQFASKTLNRTFDTIVFGSLASDGVGAGAAPPAGAPTPTGAPGNGPVAIAGPIARAAGSDGRTVAELHAQKATLVNKPVAIRGKVTKFNGGIMGKNWLHLQDGSGAMATGNFDLTVTTDAQAAVGDVVTVRGTVRTNKDFGAGYVFALIMEDATVQK